jgi:murein L,D-transpeptidase YcbB/YkuD
MIIYSRIFRENALISRSLSTHLFRFSPLLILFPLIADPCWYHRWPAQSGEVSSAPDDFFSVQRILLEKAGQETKAASEAAGEVVLAPDLVHLFYARRDYRPAWVGEKEISSQVRPLLQALKKAETDGLNPTHYHLAKIEAQLKSVEKMLKKKRPIQAEAMADFDLLCSDAFLVCAGHLAHGKVDPETHEAAWQGACIYESLAELLEDALMKNQVAEALEMLSPQNPFYLNLRRALASYRELARKINWQPFSEGLTLKSGDKRKEVKELRRRLLTLGDLAKGNSKSGRTFDDALEAALRRFQSRHGLDASGILDPATLAAINIPLDERCRQIEANLERWRWLPHDLGARFIYVNVANFELEAFEGSLKNLAMKVVVGSEAWQTPDFASQMTHLVVNPDWTIPIPVLLKETVNYVLQDPCYFRNNRMVILKGYGEQEVEIDPASIDWTKLNEKGLDFRVRQEPGPQNILGRLKFVFPNKLDIYLHDTPYQEDFAKAARAFSHGCIRAEKPVELAVWVLRGKPGWDLKQILAAIDAGDEQTVKLVEPVNVYFLYSTAWKEDDGTIQFRADIYQRNKKLIEALAAKPPLPQR